MQCPACSHENSADSRFCDECGAPLAAVCDGCGQTNRPGAKFCGGCGATLGAVGGATTAEPAERPSDDLTEKGVERCQVTILFTDLTDFTRHSRDRGPEETHAMLGRFFAAVDGIISTYGGTVDKRMGDSVMALFGAPIAHGNDQERAVRAAVDIHQAVAALSKEIGVELGVHTGLASGQVVASGVGSETHSEYTVLGDSVNLAARLVALAADGEILISDAVRRAVLNIVVADELGGVEVKGLDEPITAWRLRSVGAVESSAAARFVGRRAELRQLGGILDSYRETGAGQVIYVRGETGIGKSRLVDELAMLAENEGLSRHTGLVLDFGVCRGRDAIRAIVRSLLALPAGTPKASRGERAKRAASEGLIDDDQLPFLNDLLDVPLSPAMRAMYDAMDNQTRIDRKEMCVVTLLRRAARQQPLLITIEDLHWADATTLAFVGRIAAISGECALLLVMTSRIEGDPVDATWRQAAGASAFSTIDLRPLRDEEALELAGEFIDATNRFAQDSIARAEGNPLFLEQLLRSAEASEEEAVPGSVQSIVLARVDRLSPADKEALQAASILGQRVVPDVLRHLIDDAAYAFDGLVERHLLRPHGGELLFNHALVWESVYASLLRSQRRQLHLRAAEWFDGADAALRAEHLERAEDPRAAAAYLEAARAAADLLRFDRAIGHIERGLPLAPDPAARYELLMLHGECLREMGQPAQSIEVYRSALEHAADETARCRAWIGLAAGMRVTDEYDEALSMLAAAEEAATERGLMTELSQVHYYRGNLFFPLGNIEGCLEQHGRALECARAAGNAECEARALNGLGDAHYSGGRIATALDYFRLCIALCQQSGFGRIEVGNRYMVPWLRLYMNEPQGSLEEALEAVDSALELGHHRAEMVALLTAARALIEHDDLDAAEPHCERGLELAASLGAKRFEAFLLIFVGRIRFARHGTQAETTAIMREAVETSRQTGIGFVGPWVLSILALVTDDADEATAALREGEELLADGCVSHCHFGFYRTAIDVTLGRGDWAEVERYAAALLDFTRAEAVPSADFFAARARALARAGRGDWNDETLTSLAHVKAETERIGFHAALGAIDKALAAAPESAHASRA